MKIITTAVLLMIQCCVLQTVSAIDPPWFEIEILVFEQSNQDRLNSEKWQQQLPLPNTVNSTDFLSTPASKVVLEQVCVQGNILPIVEVIPVTEIIEEGNVDESLVDKLNEEILTQALTIDPEIPEEKPFIILDAELNQLKALATSLRRRRGYRPLLHISWRQPVESKRDSQLIRLYSGKNFGDTFNPEGDARVNIATMVSEDFMSNDQLNNDQLADNLNQLENQTSSATKESTTPFVNNSSTYYSFQETDLLNAVDGNALIQKQLNDCQQQLQRQSEQRHTDVWQLDGNIRIYVERYLHLETDLYLRIPGQEEIQLGALETSLAADRLLDSMDATEIKNDSGFGWQLGDDFLQDNQDDSLVIQDVLNKYMLQHSRRLRSNEIHYIDHPLFGLLIQIRPYEKATPDETTDILTQRNAVND